jgi:hypothetical protein
MAECIDLRERFGSDYRITFDPAYSDWHVPRDKLDPWMMQIPAQFGTIYPHGGDLLAVEVDYHPQAVKKLAVLPGVRLHQNGEHEKTFLFPVALFEQVAAIVKPKQRRRLSEERKAEITARLARFRYQAAGKREKSTLKPVPAPSDGPQPVQTAPEGF